MAKKRLGNILDASNEELQNIGKSIMGNKTVAVEKKPAPRVAPKIEEPEIKERDKMLYVTSSIHQNARVQAARRNMKLKEYITFLIQEDEKNF